MFKVEIIQTKIVATIRTGTMEQKLIEYKTFCDDPNYLKFTTLILKREWNIIVEKINAGELTIINKHMGQTIALLALDRNIPVNVLYFLITKYQDEFSGAFEYNRFMTVKEKTEVLSLENMMMCTVKINPHMFFMNKASVVQIFMDMMSLEFFEMVYEWGINMFSPIYNRDFVIHLALRSVTKNNQSDISVEKAIRVVRKCGPVLLNIGNNNMKVVEYALKNFGPAHRLTEEIRRTAENEIIRRKKICEERPGLFINRTPALPNHVTASHFEIYPGSSHFGEIFKKRNWALLLENLENMNYNDSDLTILHFALFYEAPPLVFLSFIKFITPSLFFKFRGLTPLLLALELKRSPEIIVMLATLGEGLACRVPDSANLFPLHYAILFESSHKVIKIIARQFPDALNEMGQYPYDCLPICLAMQNNYSIEPVTVKVLYDLYPKATYLSYVLDECRCDNPVLLSLVMNNASESRIMYLLDHYPHLCSETFASDTVLINACRYVFKTDHIKKIIEWYPQALHLKTEDDGNIAFHYACQRSDAENGPGNIRELFYRDPEMIFMVNKEGMTPFHYLTDDLCINDPLVQEICREMYKYSHRAQRNQRASDQMTVTVPKTKCRESFQVVVHFDADEKIKSVEQAIEEVEKNSEEMYHPDKWPPKHSSQLIHLISKKAWEEASGMVCRANMIGSSEMKKYTIFFALYFRAPVYFIEKLFRANPNCLETIWNGFYPLHMAIEWGIEEDVLMACLKHDEEAAFFVGKDGMLLLHAAAKFASKLSIVQTVYEVNREAIDTQASETDSVPLQCALNQKNSVEEIVLFLAERTDKEKSFTCKVKNARGTMTPFNLALIGYKIQNEAITEALIRQDPSAFPLFIAFAIGIPTRLIKLLIELVPESFRHKMKDKSTLLHYAICASAGEHFESNIELLLELQPETVLTRNKKGTQPFNLASKLLGEKHRLSQRIFDIGIQMLEPKTKKRNKPSKSSSNGSTPPTTPTTPNTPVTPHMPEITAEHVEMTILSEEVEEKPVLIVEEMPTSSSFAAFQDPAPILVDKPIPVKKMPNKKEARTVVVPVPAPAPTPAPAPSPPKELLRQIRIHAKIKEKRKKYEAKIKLRKMREMFLADVEMDCKQLFYDLNREIDMIGHNLIY